MIRRTKKRPKPTGDKTDHPAASGWSQAWNRLRPAKDRGGKVIRIGEYGGTAAGKTRFLYELLCGWRKAGRLVRLSKSGQRFLDLVGKAVGKRNGSLATVATSDAIRVTVRCEGGKLETLAFQDLRGEVLSDELDELASASDPSLLAKLPNWIPIVGRRRAATGQGQIARQVSRCDAFLFFFDPSSADDPEDIEKHHTRELKRVQAFLEHVLESRQNQHLPIVFVLTHHDRWEKNESICHKAEIWRSQAVAAVTKLYGDGLKGHFPPSFVARDRMSVFVASPREGEAERPLEMALALLDDQRNFLAADKRKVQYVPLLLLAGGLVAALAITAFLLVKPPPDQKKACDLSETEVQDRLHTLESLLQSQPAASLTQQRSVAQSLHAQLALITDRLACPTASPLSQPTQDRMRAALDAAGKLILAEEKSSPSPQRLANVAECLADIPDQQPNSEGLGQVQGQFWIAWRSLVTSRVGEIIERRRDLKSAPADTLAEIISALGELKKQIDDRVARRQGDSNLLAEIEAAVTFCEDRVKSGVLPVKFRLISGRWRGEKEKTIGWRDLRMADQDVCGLQPQPDPQDSNGCLLVTQQQFYRLALPLGPTSFELDMQDDRAPNGWRKLRDFAVAESGSLASLGLPLLERKQPVVTKQMAWEGYELVIEFSDFPKPPSLIWDAVADHRAEP